MKPGTAALFATILLLPLGSARGYDPNSLNPAPLPPPVDLAVKDSRRSREIPIRVMLPADSKPAPVVLYSHGLGGSREGNQYLGEHWSRRGYAVVYLQHPGSDSAVWRDAGPGERMGAMRKAASAENLLLRVADVPAVLDQLAVWNGEAGHTLSGRLDLSLVGMSGHSFGAQTTQAVSGQIHPARGDNQFTEPRIRAAIAMSPNRPNSVDPKVAFGQVKIPWMLMTGTKDGSIITNTKPDMRMEVYPALPPGDKYEVVLDGAEHSAFGDRALPGDRARRNPNHHRAILALSTAFWDAYLRKDAAAKVWLQSDSVRSVLETADRWQKK